MKKLLTVSSLARTIENISNIKSHRYSIFLEKYLLKSFSKKYISNQPIDIYQLRNECLTAFAKYILYKGVK